jgi:two-component system, sensor histidine kinase and response regulator
MPTILIIEDDDPLRLMLAELFKHAGYATVTAAGGQPGVRLARAHHPDLVLSDIRMPGMDGHAVSAELRRTPGFDSVPVLIMTAHADLPDMRRSMTLGADDYVTKPFDNADLLRIVRQHLQRAEQRRRDAGRELDSLRRRLGDLLPQHFVAPLHDIIGCASVLTIDAAVMPPVEIRDFAQSIHDAAERLHRQIENLLLYTNLDGGGAVLRSEGPVELDPLIQQTAEAIARRHGRTDALRLSLQRATVSLPREHLAKAIGEVIDNAFRHTDVESGVKVVMTVQPGACRVTVQDDGPGLDQQRAVAAAPAMTSAASSKTAGAGLGLFLSRRLTQLLGGGWELESQPDKGTTVTFSFPDERR